MQVLIQDLKLGDDRVFLKSILERASSREKDQVLIYTLISGSKNNKVIEKSYFKKIYPQTIAGIKWSAVQIATASGVCAVVENIFKQELRPTGYVNQEKLNTNDILCNQFGKYYMPD
jgi:saccharopine dehydrogenase-like NADP-dependent oxidoreductase